MLDKTEISVEIQNHIQLSLDKLTDDLVKLLQAQIDKEETFDKNEVDQLADNAQKYIIEYVNQINT